MRKRLFEIIEVADEKNQLSKVYDIFMMIVIVLSLVPIVIRDAGTISPVLDRVTAGIFILDYILRFMTADYKLKKGKKSFFLYPFTPMAVIDFISILPSLLRLSNALRVMKMFRLLGTLRVFRVFKAARYSRSMRIIINVFKKQKEALLMVYPLATGYILASALVVFSVEPETFPTFFDAIYWAAISLTTIGYGDIFPVTIIGKLLAMCSTLFGISIVALPAGIVTAGYLDELNQMRKKAGERSQNEAESGVDNDSSE